MRGRERTITHTHRHVCILACLLADRHTNENAHEEKYTFTCMHMMHTSVHHNTHTYITIPIHNIHAFIHYYSMCTYITNTHTYVHASQ